MGLLACPFCREMFEEGEARTCPVCGFALSPFHRLPPSLDAVEEGDAIPAAPEWEVLPWGFLGRGRGALVFAAIAGLGLFFLPWVHVSLPEEVAFSGFDLGRRIGWVWAAGVAWFVLLPTVGSRRTIAGMRGARVAAAFLSAIPALTALILFSRPPRGGLIPVRFEYDWPLYATLLVSLASVVVAVRFGGRVDDIRVSQGTSRGHALH